MPQLTKEQNKYLKKALKRADVCQAESGMINLDLVMAGQASNSELWALSSEAMRANITFRKALVAFSNA